MIETGTGTGTETETEGDTQEMIESPPPTGGDEAEAAQEGIPHLTEDPEPNEKTPLHHDTDETDRSEVLTPNAPK